MYWNIKNSLSHNCLFNFIVGDRGVGKTYGCKKWAIEDFLKTGSQFIYLRRYQTELKRTNKFFDDIKSAFPDVEFKVNSPTAYINNKIAGTFIPLSTSKMEKSTPYPNVNKIIFDEFILDKGYHHYLPDEVVNFLEFYNTVSRGRDVTVYFLSNALSVTNPYFLYFNLKMPYNKSISSTNDILIEKASNPEYVNAMKQTRFGKIISNTEYFNYSYGSDFLRDTNTFVEKKPYTATYFYTIVYKGVEFGIWTDINKSGLLYVSNDIDKHCKIKYSITLSDHTPNTMLLKGHSSKFIDNFIQCYKLGLVRFENINIKNMCEDIIKMTI